MLQLFYKHKTTAVALIAAAFLIGGMVRWILGQITASELTEFSVSVSAVTTVIIGLLSKDGTLKKKSE